jgi:4-oxalocrotonate tautomerase
MPIVTVQLMEGVLTTEQKKSLMDGITDAVTKVYGPPMRLFMHVVLEEIKAGDWIGAGDPITPERVRKIAPNTWRSPRSRKASRKPAHGPVTRRTV